MPSWTASMLSEFPNSFYRGVQLGLAICVLHKNFKWFHVTSGEWIYFQIEDQEGSIASLQRALQNEKVEVVNIKAKKSEKGILSIECYAKFPGDVDVMSLLGYFEECGFIHSIQF